MAKTAEEKIATLEKEIEAKKAQVKRLKNLEKEKERKARTKRLIEVGATIEKALSMELDTSEKRNVLFSFLTQKRTSRSGNTFTYSDYLRGEMEKLTEKE